MPFRALGGSVVKPFPELQRSVPRDLSFDRAIAFAADLIRIPGAPGEEGDVAARVLRELEALRFDDVWADEIGNVFGRVRGRSAGAPTVMLSCHLDAVDVGDPDSWEYAPYGGVIADGFLHGRGAMDIKGPLAVQTYAAAAFLADRLDGDVLVGHTVLEERGGWGMAHFMEHGEVRPDAVIIGEATAGDVCLGHRGRAELEVELRGIAGHASAPERARNAMDLLPAVLEALRALAAELPSDEVLGPSTMAPTRLAASPASANVIPDSVTITVDWRVLPALAEERALEQVRAFLDARVAVPAGYGLEVRFSREHQRTYTGLRRHRDLFTPGFLLAADHPVVRAAAGAVTRTTGREPGLRHWGFATDGGHVCGVHGIPAIGYAPGEERYAHTNRERLALAPSRTVYESYPAVIRSVQGALDSRSLPA